MKNILVPCDLSKPAINAYRQALVVALQSEGAVHLLHVIEPPIMNDTLLMPTLNFEEELMNDMKDKATEELKKLIKEANEAQVKISYDIQYGAVPVVIQDCIQEKQIDLVIMGTTGASGFKEYFIGSNAERVVRNARVPVLVIKDFFDRRVKNIVFPNTLDIDTQEDFIRRVKELQEFFKAKLHIVYINTPANFLVDTVVRLRLEKFAQRFMFKNYTVNVFNHLTPEGGIIDFTKMINGDLIALGTHGRKGLNHLFKGSVAEDLVNHTQCMVWTCKMNDELVEA